MSVLLRKVLRKAISGQKVDTTRRQMRQQARKEANILPYIAKALDGISDNTNPRILDLFCSDGYYGLSAKQMCPEASLVGVDISPQDIHRATVIAHYLDSDKTKFIADDVTEYVKHCERFDIVINTGGLYHIADPYRLLMSLRNVVGSYLVLQSAVTAVHNDPNYFEKPHPGWSWGSWFSHSRLQGWLNELGYQIIDAHSDAREGPNPAMIGGSYFLATLPERVR